jgi:hypothetical protein
MPFQPDWRRIEVVDEATAEVLRRKTPAQRIAIGFGLWQSARKSLLSQFLNFFRLGLLSSAVTT